MWQRGERTRRGEGYGKLRKREYLAVVCAKSENRFLVAIYELSGFLRASFMCSRCKYLDFLGNTRSHVTPICTHALWKPRTGSSRICDFAIFSLSLSLFLLTGYSISASVRNVPSGRFGRKRTAVPLSHLLRCGRAFRAAERADWLSHREFLGFRKFLATSANHIRRSLSYNEWNSTRERYPLKCDTAT